VQGSREAVSVRRRECAKSSGGCSGFGGAAAEERVGWTDQGGTRSASRIAGRLRRRDETRRKARRKARRKERREEAKRGMRR